MAKRQKPKNIKTRHIPTKVSDAVKTRHFFQCAWCGEPITDRHHIKEWHLGGEHEEVNLILLCPTHHDMAHKGQISTSQLTERKSTHLKNDRIPGGFRTLLESVKFKLGSNIFEDVKHLIAYEYQPILTTELENDTIYLSANFFDRKGNLIFWMRRNNYWAPSFYRISSSIDELTIFDIETNEVKLNIYRDGEYLAIECKTYLDKYYFEILPNKNVLVKSRKYDLVFADSKAKKFHIGIWISDSRFTREEFLIRNNEETDLNGEAIFIGSK